MVVVAEQLTVPYERQHELHDHSSQLRTALVCDLGQADIAPALSFAEVQSTETEKLSP